MDLGAPFILMAALLMKHWLVDFVFQTEYMYKNKGNLWHFGGYLHAGIHAVATWVILKTMGLYGYMVFAMVVVEFFTHYITDFAKVNLTKKLDLTPQTHGFWVLLGLDQTIHLLTYVAIAWVMFSWSFQPGDLVTINPYEYQSPMQAGDWY